ncbi:MAG: beta-lactamase family protein [Rubrivivax sp.]|nr:beta-lactamase family protein [Rubrivivax sp.]
MAPALLVLVTACATPGAGPGAGSLGRIEAAAPEAAGISSERLARLTQGFKAEIDQGRVPGVVIAVARRGKLVYHEALGFQDKAAGTPMSRDSIFRIYSMTKPLASVAAMILVEEGRIQLTDPVSKFLPAFANLQVSVQRREADGRTVSELVPASRPMLVHDLLRHTAGLAYGEVTPNAVVKDAYAKAGLFKPGVIDFDTRDLTPAEFTDRLAKQPLIGHPGQMWQYSLATDVLGRVVEAASGQRLSVFLEQRVFQPLGMKDTAFHVPAEKMSRLAQPFARPASGPFVSPQIDVSRPPGNDSGGAGGVGTAMDYLRFAQAMLNGGSLDGRRILSRTTGELMMSDHVGDRPGVPATAPELLLGTQGYGFGLGFLVRHGAGTAGVPGSAGEAMWAGYGGTYFWIDPKEQVVAVLMSQGPAATRAYYRKMVKALVYQAITD